MRRLAATTLALALLLAGCAGTSKSDASASPTQTPAAAASTASPADIAALAAVKVDGDAGAQPKFTFTQPFTLSAIASRLITPGTGAKLVDGQILAVNYYAVNGADGTDLGTSFGAATVPLTMGDTGNGTEMNAALAGQNVGARILFGVPGAESTELMLIEIVGAKTVPDRAEGAAVAPVAGLPTVTLAADGTPTLTPATGAAPSPPPPPPPPPQPAATAANNSNRPCAHAVRGRERAAGTSAAGEGQRIESMRTRAEGKSTAQHMRPPRDHM